MEEDNENITHELPGNFRNYSEDLKVEELRKEGRCMNEIIPATAKPHM